MSVSIISRIRSTEHRAQSTEHRLVDRPGLASQDAAIV
nr:MAG TPA: hypothetical protein [Caudoviricetes sp.]